MNFRPYYKSDFNALIHLSLFMTGCVVLFGIITMIITQNEHSLAGHYTFWYFFPATMLLTWAGIYVARYIHRTRIEFIHVETETTKDRLEQMKAIIFLHHGACNVPFILNIICFILFGNFFFLLFIGIIIAELAGKFPTTARVNKAIDLLNINYY